VVFGALTVHIDAQWVVVALAVAGIIAALARERQIIANKLSNLRRDAERKITADKARHRAMMTRIVDLEKAYELIGLSEEERTKRYMSPRRFVPRIQVAISDTEENDE